MTRNVIITVTGTHETDGVRQDPVVTTASGRHFVQNGKHYLLYDELPDGADGVIQNIVKFNGQILEVTKKGALESRMTFEKGKMNVTHYKTPAGGAWHDREGNCIDREQGARGNPRGL